MAPALDTLYLDPILPLAIRRNPQTLPRCDALGEVIVLTVLWSGTCRWRNVEPAHASAPAFVWAPRQRFERVRACEGWAIVLQQGLIEQIAAGCFGEPGACRFLDELQRPGSVPLDPESREEIDGTLSRLEGELESRAVAYRARARGILTELLLLLYRETIDAGEGGEEAGYRLGRVVHHIEQNFAMPLTLEELAELIGCSPAYLSRLFRSQMGQPPFEFINRVRIRHACTLLRRTESPITAIAFGVGYNNVSFFNRYFRKLMDCSPREYRRRIRG